MVQGLRRGWELARRVGEDALRDNLSIVSAGVAFYAFLAIFPALAALVSIYGLVTDPAQAREQLSTLGGVLPADVEHLLLNQMESVASAPRRALGIGIVGGVLLALPRRRKMAGFLGRFVACALSSMLMLVQVGIAQEHVVSPGELDQMVLEAGRAREQHRMQVEGYFASERVQQVLSHTKVDYRQVQRAVAQLDSDELQRLAQQVEKVEKDFAAGALTNQQLTYVVIALATAVIVLILS